MTIVYCSDQGYISYMAVSLVSLLENNKDAEELTVYCILLDVDEEDKNKLESLSRKYGRNIRIIDGTPYCDEYRFWHEDKDNMYVILLLSEILSEDKALYIDCDTVISAKIAELWNENLEECWIAAVQDIVLNRHKSEANVSKCEPYFNSGVMLVNLKAWRENELTKAFSVAYNYTTSYVFNDQRVLNYVCNGHILYLPPKYNATHWYCRYKKKHIEKAMDGNLLYSEKNVHEARLNPIVIHFAGKRTTRPWKSDCIHPYKDVFFKYEAISPIKVKYIDSSIKEIIYSIIKRLIPFSIYVFLYRKRNG